MNRYFRANEHVCCGGWFCMLKAHKILITGKSCSLMYRAKLKQLTYTLTACYTTELMQLYISASKAKTVCKQLHTEIIQS